MGGGVGAPGAAQPALDLRAGDLRLVFAGTPHVALPALEAIASSDHDLIAVLTRPDTVAGRGRAGRGRDAARSPVARWADERGLPVLQPRRPSEPEFLKELAELRPDCCPIVAYGGLVPPAALEIPERGWVNLHFSLLPAWRGAAPVQRAIMAGDEVTGASTFLLEAGLDTGPLYGLLTEHIKPTDTSGDLLARLAEAGAGLLLATLDGIASGTLAAQPQARDGVSLAPKITSDDARVTWTLPAHVVDRRIRGCTPAPGAWTTWRGDRIKLAPVRPTRGAVTAEIGGLAPGAVALERLEGRQRVLAGTGSEPVELTSVQPPGKAMMAATDWARGARPDSGECFA